MSKRILLHILIPAIFITAFLFPVQCANFGGTLDCKSAILMEASTGKVLYEKNADEKICYFKKLQ